MKLYGYINYPAFYIYIYICILIFFMMRNLDFHMVAHIVLTPNLKYQNQAKKRKNKINKISEQHLMKFPINYERFYSLLLS